MRNQKNKQPDWAKTFKLVANREEFQGLVQDEAGNGNLKETDPKNQGTVVRQQIIVPKIETVSRVTKVKPFAGVPLEYIRLASHLNIPRADRYELTEVDYAFLSSYGGRFLLNGKKVLTQAFLAEAIEQLEKKAGKENVIPRRKDWLISYLESSRKQLLKLESYQSFTDTLYNYWRSRREVLKFPLLRDLWKPSQQEVTYLLAFKTRDREKMKLRRTNRFTDDDYRDILSELSDQFLLAKKVVQRIKLREELKLDLVRNQFQAFHSQIGSIFPAKVQRFFEDVTKEQMQQKKDQLKLFKGEIDREKQIQDKNNTGITQMEESSYIQDAKLSACNFVATVLSYASQSGVEYEHIFNANSANYYQNSSSSGQFTANKNNSLLLTQSASQHASSQPVTSQPLYVSLQAEAAVEDNQPKIHLQIFENMILRSFEETQMADESFETSFGHSLGKRTCSSYFENKQNNVEKYYFGQDDQGDFRDLKKNIAQNFKRFQQIQLARKTSQIS